MPPPTSRSRQKLLAAMLLTVAIAATAYVLNERARTLALYGGPTGEASIGAAFALIDTRGRTVTQHDFAGRPMLLVFAPATARERTAAALEVATAGLQLDPRARDIGRAVVWIAAPGTSREQARADAETLIAPLSLPWTALTDPTDDIAALARSYHVPLDDADRVRRGMPPAPAAYAFLLDAGGRYRSHLVIPNDPNSFAGWIAQNL